jgi:hypothetical protein
MSTPGNPTDSFPTVLPGGKVVPAGNEWFVMIPPGDAGKSTAQKQLTELVVQYASGSAAWKDANAGKVVQGAEGNTGNPQVSEPLIKWKGPYATEALARGAAKPRQFSPNPVNNAVNAAEQGAAGGALAAVGAFLAKLGQASTWLRIAEVALGVVLVAVGVAKVVPAFTPAQMIAKRAGVKL